MAEPFRDENQAALERLAEVEQQLADARDELARAQRTAADEGKDEFKLLRDEITDLREQLTQARHYLTKYEGLYGPLDAPKPDSLSGRSKREGRDASTNIAIAAVALAVIFVLEVLQRC